MALEDHLLTESRNPRSAAIDALDRARDRRADERRGREGRRGGPGRGSARSRTADRVGRRPVPPRRPADLRRGGDVGPARRARRLGMPADVQHASRDGRRPDRRRPAAPDPGDRGGRGRPRAGARPTSPRWTSTDRDLVVGIATSGRTPYVLGAVREARRRGAATVGIACNRPSLLGARGRPGDRPPGRPRGRRRARPG